MIMFSTLNLVSLIIIYIVMIVIIYPMKKQGGCVLIAVNKIISCDILYVSSVLGIEQDF